MRGTNGVARQFGGGCFVETAQKIGGLDGKFQHIALTGSPVMHAGSSHQVTMIVGFKIQPVAESSSLGSPNSSSYRSALLRSLFFLSFTLGNDHLSMHVAVFALGFGNGGNDSVHQSIQFGIFGDGIHCCRAFEPFEKIPVVKRRAGVPAFGFAGSNFEIPECMRNFGIAHHMPHVNYHSIAANLKAFSPKTIYPTYSRHIGVPYSCIRAFRGVYQSFVLCIQAGACQQGTQHNRLFHAFLLL